MESKIPYNQTLDGRKPAQYHRIIRQFHFQPEIPKRHGDFMKYLKIPGTDLNVSNVVLGCMRLTQLSKAEANRHIHTALEEGINFFDHADIYGGGQCESHFADSLEMTPSLREKMLIQSKCGIGKGLYDFSKKHILEAADGILSRLKVEYLDVLLLHRPDALMEPEEVAEAFDTLASAGKVRYFGVSNQNSFQMQLLKKYTHQKLLFNQLQLSLAHTPLIDSGMAVNMNIDQSIDRSGGILEYCRLNDVTIQAWSPFQKGFFEGPFLGDNENYGELNRLAEEIAVRYGVTPTAVAVAWITRHPANMQVILGTMNTQRLKDSCAGSDIPLTREEWYGLYKAAGNQIP